MQTLFTLTSMRHLGSILLVACSLASAGSPGAATEVPDVVAKMVQGLSASKLDHLTSKTWIEEGREFSYRLKTIDYLGTVQRDGRRYTIAAAKFIRSSPGGSNTPPARGHGFLIVFDESFGIATHGRIDYTDFQMDGDVLKAGEKVVADFGTKEPTIRYHGWLLESAFMAYPFADRISEADWESGAFRNKP